jgi:hypothetical protein
MLTGSHQSTKGFRAEVCDSVGLGSVESTANPVPANQDHSWQRKTDELQIISRNRHESIAHYAPTRSVCRVTSQVSCTSSTTPTIPRMALPVVTSPPHFCRSAPKIIGTSRRLPSPPTREQASLGGSPSRARRAVADTKALRPFVDHERKKQHRPLLEHTLGTYTFQ